MSEQTQATPQEQLQALSQQVANLKIRAFDAEEALGQANQHAQAIVNLVIESLGLEVESLEEFVEAVQAFKATEG